jgi:Acetamidase/Formamidase family
MGARNSIAQSLASRHPPSGIRKGRTGEQSEPISRFAVVLIDGRSQICFSTRLRQVFRVECVDWTGGQIKNDDCSDDVKHVDLSQVHYLSGPIAVENASPGDLLKVEFCNLGPLEGDEWGFTGTFDQENGGGYVVCPVEVFGRTMCSCFAHVTPFFPVSSHV